MRFTVVVNMDDRKYASNLLHAIPKVDIRQEMSKTIDKYQFRISAPYTKEKMENFFKNAPTPIIYTIESADIVDDINYITEQEDTDIKDLFTAIKKLRRWTVSTRSGILYFTKDPVSFDNREGGMREFALPIDAFIRSQGWTVQDPRWVGMMGGVGVKYQKGDSKIIFWHSMADKFNGTFYFMRIQETKL